jgi:hypothetical protein
MEHALRKESLLELFLNSTLSTLDPLRHTISSFWRENKLLILKFENRLDMLGLRRGLAGETKEKRLKIYKRSNFTNQ